MSDPNRLDRVHVVNVRYINNVFYVMLSNKDKVPWDEWIILTQEERWNQ